MSSRSAPDWLTEWEYAHRGLHSGTESGSVPENTIAAAEAAVAAGMGVECDIQMSRDGVPMVFHDWELNRLTNGVGATDQSDADDLKLLSVLGTDQSPFTLHSLLELVAARVPVLVEIKSKPGYDVFLSCESVRDALRDYSGAHAVMSFDPRVAAWFKQHSPETPSGLVMREDEYGYTQTVAEREAALAEADPDFLAYHVLALPNDRVAKLREAGLPILTWTVNSPETRLIAQANADALISEGGGLG